VKTLLLFVVVLSLGIGHVTFGQVPQLISYQGRLTTPSGAAVADGNYGLTFNIYDVASGGSTLWTESQSVAVSGGLFSVNLGAIVPVSVSFDRPYWLGITVTGGSELVPRTQLTAAPYSFRSSYANYSNSAGTVTTPVHLSGAKNSSLPTLQSDASCGPYSNAIGVLGVAVSYSSAYDVSNGAPSLPAMPPTGICGLYGQVWGPDTTATGVIAQSMESGNEGRLATHSSGVYGVGYGDDKCGVLGLSWKYHGVIGRSNKLAGYGVYGVADSGTGVYGWSSTGPGVKGVSSDHDGVRGESNGSGKSGIFGYNSNPAGWAGYFTGNVYVNGTLGKAAGAFRIDHPLDPVNKYLQHSFVESPDMMDIYNGNVTTDGSGKATITLPNWFEALNRDFRYQLTVIGQFAQAIVASEISDNQFTIKTDKPNVKVSWQVTGIRHDAYAEAHRIQVEVDKQGEERGKYLSPIEHGQAENMGVDYMERSQSQFTASAVGKK
jgi:hypothetical protein